VHTFLWACFWKRAMMFSEAKKTMLNRIHYRNLSEKNCTNNTMQKQIIGWRCAPKHAAIAMHPLQRPPMKKCAENLTAASTTPSRILLGIRYSLRDSAQHVRVIVSRHAARAQPLTAPHTEPAVAVSSLAGSNGIEDSSPPATPLEHLRLPRLPILGQR
jgi:hypothetical protein